MDEQGQTTRACQIDNFFAAVWSAGIIGGVLHLQAMKSRWLSTAMCLSMILGGFCFHEFLPRVWRLAFGEWQIPRAVGEADEFHTMVRSKVFRAKLWLTHEDTFWKSLVTSLVSGPVDHLMQVLQLLDAQGGILLKLLAPGTNPCDTRTFI